MKKSLIFPSLIFSLLIFLVTLFFPDFLNADPSQQIRIDQEPSWVLVHSYNPGEKIPSDQVTDGFYCLLYDKQCNLSDSTVYTHIVIKILNNTGVQSKSEVKIDFDPSYESLSVHKMEVFRNGVRISHLNQDTPFKVIQREEELERYIYDGSLSVLHFLHDIRVGDIIEYSYSKKGFNPVFGKKYFDSFYMQMDFPIRKNRIRLIVPRGRKLYFKNHGTSAVPSIKETDANLNEYLWENENLEPAGAETDIPEWFNPFSSVQVSEFKDWEEVANLSLSLFAMPLKFSNDLEKQIEEIRLESPDKASRIRRTIEFVQNEIRYLGIEMGANGYRPTDPSLVYQRRYGDCKDKAFLLCVMLKSMDIPAWPVLVNTDLKQSLDEYHPSPVIFNHAIVLIKDGAFSYWIDPTLSNQGGLLKNLNNLDYRRGLIVEKGIRTLVPIPYDPETTKVELIERYQIQEGNGNSEINIEEKHYNNSADDLRDYLSSVSSKDFQKEFYKYYLLQYPHAKILPLEIKDEKDRDLIRITAKVLVDKIWKDSRENKNRQEIDFYSYFIRENLTRPENVKRTVPYAIGYPCHINHLIEIRLPKGFEFEEEKTSIIKNYLNFSRRVLFLKNFLMIDQEYRTLKDYVPPGKIDDYNGTVDEIEKNISYGIWKDKELDFSFLHGVLVLFKRNFEWNSFPGLVILMILLFQVFIPALKINSISFRSIRSKFYYRLSFVLTVFVTVNVIWNTSFEHPFFFAALAFLLIVHQGVGYFRVK